MLVLIVAGLLAFGGIAAMIIAGITPSFPLSSWIQALTAILAFAVVYALAGYCLWRLKNWGRLATMAIVSLTALSSVARLIVPRNPFQADAAESAIFLSLLVVAAAGWILYYLTRPNIKQIFGATNI